MTKSHTHQIPEGQLNFFNVPDDIQTMSGITPQKTTVVNIRNSVHDIFIGSPSIWGNPYVIGPDGNRKQVIQKYEQYIKDKKYLLGKLQELQGKRLGCFCKPLPCHGDVLVEILRKNNIL